MEPVSGKRLVSLDHLPFSPPETGILGASFHASEIPENLAQSNML
ncbi:hypothetical protein [Haladaptatus caseinilyticus]|nr:hypothetical protein [Haladaptatus caseinilyticus]